MTPEEIKRLWNADFGLIASGFVKMLLLTDQRWGSVAGMRWSEASIDTKTNGGMGSLYRPQHELIFVFKAGTAPHIKNVELGKHGRYGTNK